MSIMIGLGLPSSIRISILGSASVGATLSLSTSSLAFPAPISFGVQWLRNGSPIAGATDGTYTIAATDEGTEISSQVTLPDSTVVASSNTVTVPLAAPAPQTLSVTVAAFSHSPAIFDSGAARGANAADIPLSGTATDADGLQVRARLVRSDTQAAVSGWQTIATVASGTWSGAVTGQARSPHRLTAEVEIVGHTSTRVQQSGDVIVGHVVCLIGQSEDDRMFKGSFSNLTYQSIPAFVDTAAEDAVFVLRQDGTEAYADNGIEPVTPTTPLTAAMAHFANVITRNAPGEKVLLIDATVSGTSRADLTDSPDTVTGGEDTYGGRDWNTSFYDALTMIRGWGSDVGVLIDTWTAADSAANDDFRLKFTPFYIGVEADGSDYVLGTPSTAPANIRWPNILWDLSSLNRSGANVAFDPAVTKLAFHGPHRFEDFNGGALLVSKEDTRLSIRNMVADPLFAPIMRAKGPEILLYRNGERSSVPGSLSYDPTGNYWTDFAHPSAYSDDGLPARARHTAVATLYALGVGPQAAVDHWVPKFNRSYWEPTGAYVEVWYEAPDGSTPAITTTRLARGDAAIPATYPHRTEVAGFYINTDPAQSATIVSGRVRILPNTGSFTGYDTLHYGIGGASGVVQFPEDEFDAIWKNLPIVDLGIAGIDGIAVEPMPDPADIANDYAVTANFTTSAGGPYFTDPANFTANSGKMTLALRLMVPDASTTFSLISQAGAAMDVQVLGNTQTIRISVEDDTDTDLLTAYSTALTLPEGNWTDVVLSIDVPGQILRLWVDGVEDAIALPASTTGILEDTRALTLLAGSSTGLRQTIGTVEYARVWKGIASTDGSQPATTPYWEIAGDAATVNALPSKQGADAI